MINILGGFPVIVLQSFTACAWFLSESHLSGTSNRPKQIQRTFHKYFLYMLDSCKIDKATQMAAQIVVHIMFCVFNTTP